MLKLKGMMHDMWKLFPKVMEEKINALLDDAEPNRMKCFHLYKSCQSENLWNKSYEEFRAALYDFFSLPKSERTKSRFDFNLNRPMHRTIFEMFQLDFRNAIVNSASVGHVSSWAHHMLRINTRVNSPVISLEVMKKTLNFIANPGPFDKAQDIDFEDFCGAWKRICFNLFGKRYDKDLNYVLSELQLLEHEQQQLESKQQHLPRIYLTQTEIDWTQAVLTAAQEYKRLPKYPLSRGPQKESLIQIEKVTQLYEFIMDSEKPDLQPYRDKVRETLVFRCDDLLKKRVA
jgi:hypothetical protein